MSSEFYEGHRVQHIRDGLVERLPYRTTARGDRLNPTIR
jgi:hypothetical protein